MSAIEQLREALEAFTDEHVEHLQELVGQMHPGPYATAHSPEDEDPVEYSADCVRQTLAYAEEHGLETSRQLYQVRAGEADDEVLIAMTGNGPHGEVNAEAIAWLLAAGPSLVDIVAMRGSLDDLLAAAEALRRLTDSAGVVPMVDEDGDGPAEFIVVDPGKLEEAREARARLERGGGRSERLTAAATRASLDQALELLATWSHWLDLEHICYRIDYPRIVELEPGHTHTDACRCVATDKARADCDGCRMLERVIDFRTSVQP